MLSARFPGSSRSRCSSLITPCWASGLRPADLARERRLSDFHMFVEPAGFIRIALGRRAKVRALPEELSVIGRGREPAELLLEEFGECDRRAIFEIRPYDLYADRQTRL
jgi:hypothetical protein